MLTFICPNFVSNLEAASCHIGIGYEFYIHKSSAETQRLWNLSATVFLRNIHISRYLHTSMSSRFMIVLTHNQSFFDRQLICFER